jgi:hypothetical protein
VSGPDRTRAAHLPYALVLLLATGAALLAAGLARDVAPTASPAGAERDADPVAIAESSLELLPQVARRVQAIRGLRFEEVPLPRVVSAEFLSARIAAEFRRREGEPEEALAPDEAIARITGLLDGDEDMLGIVEESGDLAAAAWDTELERLYVVAGTFARSPQLLEFVLAHELTHAIEDQRFGLPDPGHGDGDRGLAELALVEGTATALMVEYARRHLDPLALGLAAFRINPGTDAIPAFLVEQLEWAYMGGARFVERLHEIAGGWALVDHALEHRPPASTSQVLHPLKYLRDESPLPVEIDTSRLRGSGWQLEDEGTVGELATRQILALGVSDARAREAATGWLGDRYELLRRGTAAQECTHPCRDALALVLRWRWGSPADGREFARAARLYVERGLGAAPAGEGVWRPEGGWVALAAAPRATTLAFAPTQALARRAAGL